MRKFAFLLSVLITAPLCSGTIISPMEIVKTGTDTFAINMPNGMSSAADGAGGYWALIGTETYPVTGGIYSCPPPIEIPDPPIILDAGDTGLWPMDIGVFGVFVTTAAPPWTAPSGVYAYDFHSIGGTEENPLNLYAIDDSFVEAYLVDTYVPEPTTILLLGLGTVLLKRRR